MNNGKQVRTKHSWCSLSKQVRLSFVQYRLRHPSFTAPRGPPSPKIREKAKSLCDSLICAANYLHYYNSVGQQGNFYKNYFTLAMEFAQTVSIKYSSLLKQNYCNERYSLNFKITAPNPMPSPGSWVAKRRRGIE